MRRRGRLTPSCLRQRTDVLEPTLRRHRPGFKECLARCADAAGGAGSARYSPGSSVDARGRLLDLLGDVKIMSEVSDPALIDVIDRHSLMASFCGSLIVAGLDDAGTKRAGVVGALLARPDPIRTARHPELVALAEVATEQLVRHRADPPT